jgi:hypothetical protein
MRNSNTIGVDLAKNVIQVSVVTPANKELSNKELSRIKSSGQDNPRHGGGSVQAGA